MPQTAFGCISMAWDGGRWLDHLNNVALWQCQPHQSFFTKIIPLKIALRKNNFIKIRLRSEVYVNKKHWLTQSAWLSLEHEVLCDSHSRAMASHLHIPISSTMTQITLQATPYSSWVGIFAFCLLRVLWKAWVDKHCSRTNTSDSHKIDRYNTVTFNWLSVPVQFKLNYSP